MNAADGTVGDVVVVAARRVNAEHAHDALPLIAMAGNIEPENLAGYQMGHLVRDGIGLKIGNVFHQEHRVVADEILGVKRLAGGTPAQVKRHVRHREVAVKLLTGQLEVFGGGMKRALLDDNRHHFCAGAHRLDHARQPNRIR